MSAASRNMRRAAGLLGAFGIATSCAASTTSRLNLPPLQTVARVELSRYLGTWYEIASFPQYFQRGCTASTATYSLLPDGDIKVFNRCRKNTVDGKEKTAIGRARVVDKETNSKLEVSFFRPFWGDYWIIDLAEDYSYAVVSHPGRDYLWILSRSPTMDENTYQAIIARLRAQGYETERLQKTPHLVPPATAEGGSQTAEKS